MPHAIIRGHNCRRHEVDFENATVEVFVNDQNLELMAEALEEEQPWQKKRFALINLLRSKFVKSVAEITSKHSIAMKVVK
ncbi:hypothetical protein N9O21_00940 [Rhodobacteraceae bacterium]|nr:hypothetical protein [Paracoccaceae bacterium]